LRYIDKRVTCNLKRQRLSNLKAYKGFKTTSIVIGLIGLTFQMPIMIGDILKAIENQKLTGGARAQSEFFLMPMIFLGGIFAIIGLVLIFSNGLTDLLWEGEKYKKNILVYCILALTILIPTVGSYLILGLMYYGWK
jgi:hypothetical protein